MLSLLLSAQRLTQNSLRRFAAAMAHSQTACRWVHSSHSWGELSDWEECNAASGLQLSLGEIGKEHSLEARGRQRLPCAPWRWPSMPYAICLSYSTLFPVSKSGN